MDKKKKVLIWFKENGENGGPYVSHLRIMNSGLKEKYEFIPIYFPRAREALTFSGFSRLVKEIKKAKPDIVHIAGLQDDGFLELLITRVAYNAKTVVAVHGSTNEASFISSFRKNLAAVFEHWTLKHCDIAYGVSDYVSSWPICHMRHCNYFGTIYNFYDFSQSYSREDEINTRAAIRKELSIPSDMPVVVSTGRIRVEKGFKDIAEIICSPKTGNAYHIILGEGDYLSQMREYVESKGKVDHVRFLGYREGVTKYLIASDIFLFCSWHETFGNSVIEASACGLPVIATNVGGIPEIVVDGYSGYLCHQGDIDTFINRLNTLINDLDCAYEFGSNGRKYVYDKFAQHKIEARLDKMYSGLFENE